MLLILLHTQICSLNQPVLSNMDEVSCCPLMGVRNHTLQAFTDNKSIRFNHCTTLPFIKVYYKVQFLITWLSSFGIIFCSWQIKRNSSKFLFFYFYPIFLEGKDNLQTKYDRKPTRITSLSHCVYSFHSNTTKIGGNSV